MGGPSSRTTNEDEDSSDIEPQGEYEVKVGDPAFSYKDLAHYWRYEVKLILCCCVFSFLAFILTVTALGTDYWLVMTFERHHGNLSGIAKEDLRSKGHMGLWRQCNIKHDGKTHCFLSELFMIDDHKTHDPEIDLVLLNYSRSEVAFGLITVLLMVVVMTFDGYSFKYPRYMIKRLCCLLHLMAGSTGLICVEVFINGVKFEMKNAPIRHPKHTSWSYGYSFFLVCTGIGLNATCFLVFLAYSRKRVRRLSRCKAVAKEDEPLNLHRVS